MPSKEFTLGIPVASTLLLWLTSCTLLRLALSRLSMRSFCHLCPSLTPLGWTQLWNFFSTDAIGEVSQQSFQGFPSVVGFPPKPWQSCRIDFQQMECLAEYIHHAKKNILQQTAACCWFCSSSKHHASIDAKSKATTSKSNKQSNCICY